MTAAFLVPLDFHFLCLFILTLYIRTVSQSKSKQYRHHAAQYSVCGAPTELVDHFLQQRAPYKDSSALPQHNDPKCQGPPHFEVLADDNEARGKHKASSHAKKNTVG